MIGAKVALSMLQADGSYKRLHSEREIEADTRISINDFMTNISIKYSVDIDGLSLYDCLKQSNQSVVIPLLKSPFKSDFLEKTLSDIISPLKQAGAISNCALLVLNVKYLSGERDRLHMDLINQKDAAQKALDIVIAALKDAHKPAVAGKNKGGKRKTRRYK